MSVDRILRMHYNLICPNNQFTFDTKVMKPSIEFKHFQFAASNYPSEYMTVLCVYFQSWSFCQTSGRTVHVIRDQIEAASRSVFVLENA